MIYNYLIKKNNYPPTTDPYVVCILRRAFVAESQWFLCWIQEIISKKWQLALRRNEMPCEHYGERSWVKIVPDCLQAYLNPKHGSNKRLHINCFFSHTMSVLLWLLWYRLALSVERLRGIAISDDKSFTRDIYFERNSTIQISGR